MTLGTVSRITDRGDGTTTVTYEGPAVLGGAQNITVDEMPDELTVGETVEVSYAPPRVERA